MKCFSNRLNVKSVASNLSNAVQKAGQVFSALCSSHLHVLQLHKNGVDLGDDASDRVFHAIDSPLQNGELFVRHSSARHTSKRTLDTARVFVAVV